ncbi:hypothetical protein PV08_03503 [Exophiala spinifera]|uniref:Uncharacterized protein n=1 Tax=Exophiala spinifera TaxID=91928 RepID=A0A0D2C6K5_9EURO|nr:uncharacterized protein PV08_03503 [Exophiala spinifera]KIW19209.1 hypothetical protein PV08_03503 [Exophiala spinifera]
MVRNLSGLRRTSLVTSPTADVYGDVGYSTLPSDVVDCLIVRCDGSDVQESTSSSFGSPEWLTPSHNPFSAFQVRSIGAPPVEAGTSTTVEVVPADDARSLVTRSLSLGPSMIEHPDLPWQEKMLFHHYVQQVASNMLPFQHSRNPWKSYYPAVALGSSCGDQRSLYHAMISHAAFHLAQLGVTQHEEFSAIGTNRYTTAISELRSTLEVEPGEFATIIGSIFSLMFAEVRLSSPMTSLTVVTREQVYSGRSRKWRYHHKGAWTLVQQHRDKILWDTTELASVSLQCLNIIKIIGETATGVISDLDSEESLDSPLQDSDTSLASLIAATPAFGFTLGASKPILDCISKINRLQQNANQWNNESFSQRDDMLEDILTQLNSCRRKTLHSLQAEETNSPLDPTEDTPEVLHQVKAFLYATYVYLYRTIFDSPPANVRNYVSETLHNVDAFYAKSSGNFSIWPAFIAAVEAYTPEDVEAAQRWLLRSTCYGMGNRQALRAVVEEVWRRRAQISELVGVERGVIAVDWRKVMKDMNYDVLIV